MKNLVLLVLVSSMFFAIWALPCTAEEREKEELKLALLVIDVQNIWLPEMAEEGKDEALRNINELIDLFRGYDRPVIRIYHSDLERGPKPGTEAFEFPDTIAITDDDLMIVKNYPSSFTKTELEKILREKGCNTLFICGLSATGCALATYYGGMDREFLTLMVKGALLSHNASYTRIIEDICGSMTIEEVEETLKDPYM